MSADNGIYIAKFPKGESFEYRVAHLQNIENCNDSPVEHDEMPDHYRLVMFGDAKAFSSLESAEDYARELDCNIAYVQYGINVIEFDRPLLEKTVDEANEWLRLFWEEFDADVKKMNDIVANRHDGKKL